MPDGGGKSTFPLSQIPIHSAKYALTQDSTDTEAHPEAVTHQVDAVISARLARLARSGAAATLGGAADTLVRVLVGEEVVRADILALLAVPVVDTLLTDVHVEPAGAPRALVLLGCKPWALVLLGQEQQPGSRTQPDR